MHIEDFRCAKCNKKLAEHAITEGKLQVKCPRCGHISSLDKQQVEIIAEIFQEWANAVYKGLENFYKKE